MTTDAGTTYVGLVRGINVGTSTLVPMAEFKQMFEQLGYGSVATLLRSGNVVFGSRQPVGTAEVTAIEAEFAARFGFAAGFVVLAADRFRRIAAANPLLEIGTDPSKLVVAFVPPGIRADAVTLPDASALLPEVIAVTPDAVYAWNANGISKSAIPPSFWKQLGPVYTARNVNTVNKLLLMIDEAEQSIVRAERS